MIELALEEMTVRPSRPPTDRHGVPQKPRHWPAGRPRPHPRNRHAN